jgi:glycosyltransferase involved in cell wall biosynthesis
LDSVSGVDYQSEKQRILHLIKGLGRGGAEVLLDETLRAADREAFEYSYAYFLPRKDKLQLSLLEQGVNVKCLEARSSLSILLSIPRVITLLRRWRTDLLHCHLPLAGVVGRVAGRVAGVPVVYTEHNVLERYHPLTRRLNKVTWSLQNQVVAVSGEVERSIARHTRSEVPVRVVRNGIGIEHLPASESAALAVRTELGITPETPVVGTIAVFRPQKRLDIWLQAAARILDVVPDAEFLIVGDGVLRPEIESFATQLNLSNKVHFTGLKEDVGPYLSAMDVFMMSSEFEGLPLAMLEAMAAERAVVATDVGGIREVIRNAEIGKLVPFGDVGQLASESLDLLHNRGLRRKLGFAARKRVEEKFSVQRMARELESIYREVIGNESA